MKNTAIVNYYYFDTTNAEHKAAYNQMCERLKAAGLRKFDSLSGSTTDDFYKKYIIPFDGQPVEMDLQYIFNNQWNTGPIAGGNGARLMDWAECIFPNKAIKRGYSLTLSPELIAARENRCKCGYCGKQYDKATAPQYCDNCIGSEYLKAEDLHLLQVGPILEEKTRRAGSVPAEMVVEYEEAQRVARAARLEKRHAAELQRIEDKKRAADIEYRTMKKLIEHGAPVDNLIYYGHRGVFTYGWREKLPAAAAEKLLDKVCKIQFEDGVNFEFITDRGLLTNM